MGICSNSRHQQDIETDNPPRKLAELDGNPTISEDVAVVILPKHEQQSSGSAARKKFRANITNTQQSINENFQYFYKPFIPNEFTKRLVFQHQNRISFMDEYLPMLIRNQFKNLIQLGINQCVLGNLGCKILSRAQLPLLEKLGLIENCISTGGVIHLTKLPLKNLRQLYLGSNKISNGLPYLIKITMPRIEYINLQNNSVLSCEFEWILIGRFKKLELIDLTWNKIQNLKEKVKKKQYFFMRYFNYVLTC